MKVKKFNEMATHKETVRLSDICQGDYFDDLIGFISVEQKQIKFDGEKGFVDYECVMKRRSDGKFFKFIYTDYGKGDSNIKEQIAYEVERKEKTVYYYE